MDYEINLKQVNNEYVAKSSKIPGFEAKGKTADAAIKALDAEISKMAPELEILNRIKELEDRMKQNLTNQVFVLKTKQQQLEENIVILQKRVYELENINNER